MNKPLALLWGVATIVPVLGFIYIFGFIDLPESGENYEKMKEAWDRSFEVQGYLTLLMFVLLASYITYLFRTAHVPKDKKALWAVVLFLGNFIAMPVFWFIYVWRPLLVNDKPSAT